jgi:RimJ/RimL family protein N-acetyltransferase
MTVPVLETERLRLREWREADVAPLGEFYTDAAVTRFLSVPRDRSDVWRFMAVRIGHWVLRGYGPWALEEKTTGQWVGHCGLWNPHGWPEPELMWSLVPGARGRGYATEAARRARGFAYRDLGWTTVVSCIVPENIASQRVAQRLGATLERSVELMGHQTGLYRHPAPSQS